MAAGLTNDGTILLESQNNAYSDTLATGSGTFTNAADGIIQVTAGTGGGRHDHGQPHELGGDQRRCGHDSGCQLPHDGRDVCE